ncbi:Hpt domain-containing protein [Sulfurimonas sp.]|nr:Hpt domain-containing protein [Sulfurimonas sp.]
MLIYNYKKEFLGIDEADITALGLSDLADLRAEAADFADLFVKTPGHIHNFKHVHWIDYVLDGSGAEAKAIIHIKNKNFSTVINIKTIFLVDNPSSNAYLIELTNLRQLSGSQLDRLSSDISTREAPVSTTEATELFTEKGSITHTQSPSKETTAVAFDPYEESEPEASTKMDMYENNIVTEENFAVDEEPLQIDMDDTDEEVYTEPEPTPEVQEKVTPPVSQPSQEIEGEFSDYVYNPHVASDELGLPVDLIQEFIEDFISQADSFKTELYNSVRDNDLDHLKIQSHKLKGVAANLRIQDALDALTTINSSEDSDEILTNLDNFYIMINKLGNAPADIPSVNEEVVIPEEEDDEEDEFVLSFKNDNTPEVPKQEETVVEEEILDIHVPEAISLPELADDEFVAPVNEAIDEENLPTLEDDIEIPQEEEVIYDKASIANDFGLDIESFNELFDDFIQESKEMINTIVQAAEENNLTACKTTASKMKGMSDNMRIHRFDTELDEIVGALSSQDVKEHVQIVSAQLDQISNLESN